jgi:hypothetical protein
VTDGIETEISGPEVRKDMEVIIGEQIADKSDGMSNLLGPPKFFGKGAGKGRP